MSWQVQPLSSHKKKYVWPLFAPPSSVPTLRIEFSRAMNISIWLFRCFFTSKAFSFAPQACENWLFILPLPRLILPFDMSTPKPVAVLAVPPECFQWIGICVAGKWQLIRTKVFCANVFVLLNLTADKVWNCWERRQSRGTPPSVSPALIIQESVWCSGPSPALWEVIFNPFFWNGAKSFTWYPKQWVREQRNHWFLHCERWMLYSGASGIHSE